MIDTQMTDAQENTLEEHFPAMLPIATGLLLPWQQEQPRGALCRALVALECDGVSRRLRREFLRTALTLPPPEAVSLLRTVRPQSLLGAEREIERALVEGVHAVPFHDRRFPGLLREIPDPPLLLWVRGTATELLSDEAEGNWRIAIVGARTATAYGAGVAYEIAREVTALGGTVVSGLALGIDAAAHEGALEAARHMGPEGSAGVAVLGSGLGRIYPSRNAMLASDLTSNRGLVLSEYRLETPPAQHRFPERNRLVSGLAHAVIVVEAGERSGALITARLAAEQGREVLAVPGNITSAMSTGTNRLLTEGATPYRSMDDLLQALPRLRKLASTSTKTTPTKPRREPDRSLLLSGLSEPDRTLAGALLQALDRCERAAFDDLLNTLKADPAHLRALLVQLELTGLVHPHPGNFYSLHRFIDT